jgi:uncharacterized protein
MYKLSKYNYNVKQGQRVIYFNGKTGFSFSVSQEEHEKITEKLNDLVSLCIHHNSVFCKFREWGFIVDENIDEVDSIKLQNKQAIMSDKFYRLIINPTEECIFNCWYCTQHKQNTGYMREQIQNKVKKHLVFMFEKERITGLYLDWFGGEPLMYFDEVVYPLAKYAFELIEHYQLPFIQHATTNAYLINSTMVQKMKEINLKSFQITIDGDEKRHNSIRNINGKPSYYRIVRNIILLCEQISDVKIILRLNYDAYTLFLSDIEKVFEQIPKKYRQNIFPDFQRVWQTKKSKMEDNPFLLDIYKQCCFLGYNTEIPMGFHIGKSFRCYADRYYHSIINYDGKVYKCTLNMDKEDGTLLDNGEITWNKQTLIQLYSNATFENKKCLRCKHLPLCLGPCSQQAKRKSNSFCYLDMAEVNIDQFIIEVHNKKKNILGIK